MKEANCRKTALILIDVQNGFLHPTYWGPSRSTPECEKNIAQLLLSARRYNATTYAPTKESNAVLICHVHHHSTSSASLLHPDAQIEIDGKSLPSVHAQSWASPLPGETVWVKKVNSAFVGTWLEAYLREKGVRQLIICGLTTDHCVSTTTRMANNLRIVDIVGDNSEVVEVGDIVLVGDACATFAKGAFDAETVHQVNLTSLNEEFAQVKSTADVVTQVFADSL